MSVYVRCLHASDEFTTLLDLRSIRLIQVNWSSKLKALSNTIELSGADAHGRQCSIRRKGRTDDESDGWLHGMVFCD